MLAKITLFLVLNFLALALGGLFTGKGVPSDWYQELNKAPWTPPGWVFGAAWTLIMVCFSFFMAYALEGTANKKQLWFLFGLQWILNVAWNPSFFYLQQVFMALVLISLLTLLIAYLLFNYYPILKVKTLFIVPYLLWLLIATSLNAYIYLKN